MNKSEFLGLNLPSRDNTTDIADINAISDNFKTIDSAFLDLVKKKFPEFQTKENINLNFDDDSTNDEQYPSVPAVVNFTNRKIDPFKIVNSASGNAIALKDSAKDKLNGLKLFGKTTQNGTPTPDAPIPLVSVGDSGSFEVGVYGKNLLSLNLGSGLSYGIQYAQNSDGSVTLSGTATGEGAVCMITHRNLPCGVPLTLGGCDGLIYDVNGTFKGDWFNGSTVILEKGWYVNTYFYYVVVGTVLNKTIYPQIEIGTQATPYEPFTKQGLTIPYTLRSVGEVKDEIDFTKGSVTENTYNKVFTGAESFNLRTDTTGGGYYFEYYDFNLNAPKTDYDQNTVCNRLPVIPTLWNKNETGYMIASDKSIRLRIDEITTVAELQAKLKEWYDGGNPLTIITERATPIETPLSETELNAYRQLYTNKGNTTILSEADMEVSYVADPKLYIDNKIAELTALTLEV